MWKAYGARRKKETLSKSSAEALVSPDLRGSLEASPSVASNLRLTQLLKFKVSPDAGEGVAWTRGGSQ